MSITYNSSYGERIQGFDPDKEKIYGLITEYFNKPVMTKIKDVETYSMYMCKMYCLLTNECRYLVAFSLRDSTPLNSLSPLSDIKWVSFQTRTLEDKHELDTHGYQPKRIDALNKMIKKESVNKDSTVYTCPDIPCISISLLHTKSVKEYSDSGTVLTALETYQTIICFKD